MAKIAPFEDISEEYDDWFVKHKNKYDAELRALKCFIPPDGEGLEVGIGSGKFAVPLGIKIGDEPSQKMAEKARELSIHVLPGIAEDLPVSDNSFDFVLMVTTICFVDDLKKTFQEAFRVLKKRALLSSALLIKTANWAKYIERTKKKAVFIKLLIFSQQRRF